MHAETYERPMTLEQGSIYFLIERGNGKDEAVLTPVRFAGYDPCPAMVIVEQNARRLRCPREDLFRAAGISAWPRALTI